MKHNLKKFLALVLVAGMTASILPTAYVSASEENAVTDLSSSTESVTDTASANLTYLDERGNHIEDTATSVKLENKNAFYNTDTVTFQEPDANVLSDAKTALDKSLPNGYSVQYAYDISVFDKDGNVIEPAQKTKVSMYLPEEVITEIEKNQNISLWHVPQDGDPEKIDFTINTEKDGVDLFGVRVGGSEEKDQKYISFETESLSPFLFVEEKNNDETKDASDEKSETPGADEKEKASETAVAEAKDGDTKSLDNASDSANATDQTSESETSAKAAPNAMMGMNEADDSETAEATDEGAENETKATIESFSTSLYSGAKKQKDGTYLYTPSNASAGHAFGYRISFSTSGEGNLPANSVKITIPANVYTDRSGKGADSITWSIPSESDIAAAKNPDGSLNMDLIDADSYYAYRKEGNNYVIYNFREVSAAQNNYIELTYALTNQTFSYQDMKGYDFTANMTVGNGETAKSASAPAITTKIDTNAEINSVSVQYPYNRIKSWNGAWGNASDLGIDPEKYYYLVFNIASNITATQPYDFALSDDSLKSNLGDKMVILGYRMQGQSTYSKTYTTQKNQQFSGTRYDSVLVGIPLDTYQGQKYWDATQYKVSGNVTPGDGLDEATKATGSNRWSWTQPEFHAPTGQYYGLKRGDGSYRTYGYTYLPNHYSSSRSLKLGKWTRYDLESFNGYDDTPITLTKYGNFDYASYIYGYPGSSTADGDVKVPGNYWKKEVKYELTDEGVFLMNTDAAVGSKDGSSNRTIVNGGVIPEIAGKKTAVKLTNEDFRIDKLDYSWMLRDASLDDETMQFSQSGVTYKDDDVLKFEGKFNGSDNWVTFAAYDIKNGTASPVDDYVSSMTSGTITFKDGQDCTAYRVTTANAHYFTEIFTVPSYSLKNSQTVTELLKGARVALLLNNNSSKVYESNKDGTFKDSPMVTSNQSDTDYATVSQKDSSLTKRVISHSNNTRSRKYTITWRIDESETVTAGEDGNTSYLPQESGIFYDLLPAGVIFDPDSVSVNTGEGTYEVKTIKNYNKTGRTMLIVKINKEADHYWFTFDTVSSWNSVKDYGENIYNPVAYETGNENITKGYPDNGGTKTVKGDDVANPVLKYPELMSDVAKQTGMSDTSVTDAKFLYAGYTWDINTLMSASAGLTKKVKADKDKQYDSSTDTTINDEYSYELRFMNAPGAANSAKNIVFFDSLENFGLSSKKDDGTSSSWHGILTDIDTTQLEKEGAAPKVYISTKANLDPTVDNDVTDSSVWTLVTSDTDLSNAKAVTIDVSKKPDGSDFTLAPDKSLVAYLSMKAPETAPDPIEGETYPYAYNNIYVKDTLFNTDDVDNTQDYLIHYDYTKVSLTVSGSMYVKKISSKTKDPAEGLSFHLFGKSSYGNAVDETLKTNADGMISVDKLEKGTYTLQETDATQDFLLDPTEHKVVIDGQGNCTVDKKATTKDKPVEIENNPRVHTDVSFKKVDSLYVSQKLAGAQYRLSRRSDYGTDVLMTAESGSDGIVRFTNVEKGTYELKEIKAPEDHILDTSTYTVTIDEDANFTITSGSGSTSSTPVSTDPVDFSYTGDVQTYTIPVSGKYKLEVWGAQGGYRSNASNGGKGGYSAGTVSLSKGDSLYVYVGGSGNTGGTSGGFNGGGRRAGYNGGGGASDIRINDDSFYARVIVAGGGGSDGKSSGGGGYGGGLNGGSYTNSGYGNGGGGASQTSAGSNGGNGTAGSFGQGGYGAYANSGYGGAGGGGWYGGGGTYPDGSGDDDKAGGGGSGYVYTSGTASNYPSGCLLTSDYYLTDAQTIAGNTSMPSPDGDTETGHSGNGYARLTLVEQSGPAPVTKDAQGYYNLTNEPLHYFTFTKKSSYDKSVQGGAEFTLTGTSDRGTEVNAKAVSGEGTGTVRFSKLEPGTYVMKETKSPDGFADNSSQSYAVNIKSDGSYTISGLTKDSSGIYELYNTKLQDKQITITKVWDDGITNHDPNDLAITITTKVPDASNRQYTIIYDANGGTYK